MMKAIIFSFMVCRFFATYGQMQDKRLLMVIDMQENLINPQSKLHIDTCGIDSFFINVNSTISKFKQKGNSIVYILNEWTNPVQNWMTGNVCKKGGAGVGFDKRLLIAGAMIFHKAKPNSLSNKDLLKFINKNNITEVYIVGLMAEHCVKATAKGLKSEKLKVAVVEDALGSKSPKHKLRTIAYFKRNNIKILKEKELYYL